jgi:hypothetical protein
MPTGYTAEIYDGKEVTFKDFVMECARAFGALITMRDDPSHTAIPEEFLPSMWNADELEKARARLAQVRSWDEEQSESESQKDYSEAMQHWHKRIIEMAELCLRYEAMLAKVQAWEPPTANHQGLKDFMIQQLESSIDFDCCYKLDMPHKLPGGDYKAQQIKAAERDIQYHTAEQKKEVERTQERNAWVRALRESLS